METSSLKKLYNKYNQYVKLIQEAQDKHGFIDSSNCDSLLFTGLTGSSSQVEVNIFAAFDSQTDLWHRRPIENPCFDCKTKKDLGSKSTISRDMLIGLAWYAYYNERLDISEQVIQHAIKNWGIMGCAESPKQKWGRCQIMPALFATFCWISYRLGGPSRPWARWIPADLGHEGLTGFQAHLQMLHIILRSELESKMLFEDVVHHHSKRQPNNPLFQYAAGRFDEAIHTLLNKDLWPFDRLPDKQDRTEGWLFQRDYGDDWKPHDYKDHQHSGGDFIFLAYLILKENGKVV